MFRVRITPQRLPRVRSTQQFRFFEAEPEPYFVQRPLPQYRSRKELLLESLLANVRASHQPRDVFFYEYENDLVRALWAERQRLDDSSSDDMCKDLDPWSLECRQYDV